MLSQFQLIFMFNRLFDLWFVKRIWQWQWLIDVHEHCFCWFSCQSVRCWHVLRLFYYWLYLSVVFCQIPWLLFRWNWDFAAEMLCKRQDVCRRAVMCILLNCFLVISPYIFSICDTTGDEFLAYEGGGLALQVKIPKCLNFVRSIWFNFV